MEQQPYRRLDANTHRTHFAARVKFLCDRTRNWVSMELPLAFVMITLAKGHCTLSLSTSHAQHSCLALPPQVLVPSRDRAPSVMIGRKVARDRLQDTRTPRTASRLAVHPHAYEVGAKFRKRKDGL